MAPQSPFGTPSLGSSKRVPRSFRELIKGGETPQDAAGGEGGIRTLGTLLEYGALAKRCFRPLSHLTNNRAVSLAIGWKASIGKRLDVDSSASRFGHLHLTTGS